MARLLQVFAALMLAAGAMLLSLTPFGRWAEREIGLPLLYALRGSVEVPGEAMVVALEQGSVEWLQFHSVDLGRAAPALDDCLTPHARERLVNMRNIGDVPRGLHACLIEELVKRNARVVIFDILFHAETPDDDRLAEAMSGARSVVLFERVRVDDMPGIPGGIVQRILPRPVFRDAAAETAGFLVNAPVGKHLEGYLLRLAPFPSLRTLPEAAYAHFTDSRPPTAEGDRHRDVWLYGPPRAVQTHTIRDVFDVRARNPLPDDLGGMAVFIGVSDPGYLGTIDHYRVPVLDGARDQMGGVEIAATAFLNLLHDDVPMRPEPDLRAGIVFGTAFLLFLAAFVLPGAYAIWVPVGLSLAAIAAAGAAFAMMHLVLPLAVPALAGGTLAVVLAIFGRYRFARRIVGRLAPRQVAGALLSRGRAERGSVRVQDATVLFTDLAGSTGMGDALDHESYARLINIYYDSATAAVEAEGGMVVEFMGDGILALFPEEFTGPEHASRAIAALRRILGDIAKQAESARQAGGRLRLRMGLNTGRTATGDVGARHRYNFKALGDAVNVAARLEQLGKEYDDGKGTVVLASAATVRAAGLSAEETEDLGEIALRGKPRPVHVHRILV